MTDNTMTKRNRTKGFYRILYVLSEKMANVFHDSWIQHSKDKINVNRITVLSCQLSPSLVLVFNIQWGSRTLQKRSWKNLMLYCEPMEVENTINHTLVCQWFAETNGYRNVLQCMYFNSFLYT